MYTVKKPHAEAGPNAKAVASTAYAAAERPKPVVPGGQDKGGASKGVGEGMLRVAAAGCKRRCAWGKAEGLCHTRVCSMASER